MYLVIQDRNEINEEIIWRGENFSVGMQEFNTHKNSCEKGDFEVLELIRDKPGEAPAVERIFRFK